MTKVFVESEQDEGMEQNDWIGTEYGRKKFWTAAEELGFDTDTVHKAFGMESMKQFPDSIDSAIDYLKELAISQEALAQDTAKEARKDVQTRKMIAVGEFLYRPPEGPSQALPEAANVAWCKIQRPGGPVWSVTIRGVGLSETAADAIDRDTIRRIYNFEKFFRSDGYHAVYDGRNQTGPIMTNKEAYDVAKQAKQASRAPAEVHMKDTVLDLEEARTTAASTSAPPVTSAPQVPSSTPPSTTNASPPPPPQTEPQQAVAAGAEQMTATEFLKVTAPQGTPVIEFWRPNRRYPELTYKWGIQSFLDGPGAAMAAAGWTFAHFPVGTEHQCPLNIFWTVSPKNDKWKDIQRVTMR